MLVAATHVHHQKPPLVFVEEPAAGGSQAGTVQTGKGGGSKGLGEGALSDPLRPERASAVGLRARIALRVLPEGEGKPALSQRQAVAEPSRGHLDKAEEEEEEEEEEEGAGLCSSSASGKTRTGR